MSVMKITQTIGDYSVSLYAGLFIALIFGIILFTIGHILAILFGMVIILTSLIRCIQLKLRLQNKVESVALYVKGREVILRNKKTIMKIGKDNINTIDVKNISRRGGIVFQYIIALSNQANYQTVSIVSLFDKIPWDKPEESGLIKKLESLGFSFQLSNLDSHQSLQINE